MRASIPLSAAGTRSRILTRVAVAALLAGLAAGCSADSERFSANPFANPFSSDDAANAGTTQAAPTGTVRRHSLPPAGTAPLRHVAAQPLPPVGSVRTVAAQPSPSYHMARGPSPAGVTGSIEPRAGRTLASAAGSWSGTGGTVVTAQDGDTAGSLSNRYGVPANAIMTVNGLSSPVLAAGQQITIPVFSKTAPARAVAAPLAEAEPAPVRTMPSVRTVPVREVATREAPRTLPVREAARPVAPREEPRVVGSIEPASPAAAIERQAGGVHVVKPGETLTAIALAYGTTRPRLARENGIDEWTSVRIGQKLRVPAQTARATAAESAARQPRAIAQAEPVRMKPKHGALAQAEPVRAKAGRGQVAQADSSTDVPAAPVHAVTTKPVRKVKLAAAAPAETAAPPAKHAPATRVAMADPAPVADPAPAPEPAPVAAPAQPAAPAAPQFRWPVRGRVIQSFGQSSDGLNIAVPEGTDVKAADDGVVAYAGNELKGYGNLVLIRHANGYVTAYAHAKDLNVKRGDHVTRGETIATAGQTGNVTSPQLLFELRKGATPVDPRGYLAGT